MPQKCNARSEANRTRHLTTFMNTLTNSAPVTVLNKICQSIRSIPIDEIDHDIFWSNVDKGESCWLWRPSTTGAYGSFWFKKTRYLAHRVAWSITNGQIPKGFYCCHRCDTPSCVNPEHIFLGTASENLADMHSKGRHSCDRHGEKNGSSKLTRAIADSVRIEYSNGVTINSLAEKYSISRSAITRIVRYETWRRDGDPAQITGFDGNRHASAKLSNEKAKQIRELSKSGIKRSVLAEMFGVSVGLIHKVNSGAIWKASL